ncbi:MAG: hypothetical protein MK198_10055 [Gracilimonas sp.]|uniref:hypothetical protein n=1 Tax=Gracilimonas sp. TaxID=1974203 RepID=UPI00375089AA|nr:hypothetical protein [Gracilimonas sp.]
MKLKTYVNNIVAIIAIVTLVGGFQVSRGESAKELVSIESKLGLNEAYAGPCARRGCDGMPSYCTSYYVIEIGNGGWLRHCNGTALAL